MRPNPHRLARVALAIAIAMAIATFVSACSGSDDPPQKDSTAPAPDSSQIDRGAADLPRPDLGIDGAVPVDQRLVDAPIQEPDQKRPPDLDVTGPRVVATEPADQAQDGPLWSSITATFSEPIDISKATTSSFTVKVGGLVGVPGQVVAGGDMAVFTPAAPLCPRTSHQGTLTTALTDLAGNPLAADYHFTFTTVDGAWSPPRSGSLDAREPAVAIAENGDVFVAWADNDHIVVHRRGRTSSVWDAPQQVDAVAGHGYAWGPALAADAVGNAIVVWRQNAPSPTWSDGYLARYDAATKTWTAAQSFESSAAETGRAEVAMNPDGTALLLFLQGSWPTSSYFDGTSWSAPAAVPDPGPNASHYAIAVAREGVNAFIGAWIEKVGYLDYTLRASRFDGATKTWSTASTPIATGLPWVYSIALAAGPTASYLAYLGPVAGNTSTVYVARLAAGSWGTPVAVDQNGNAYVDEPSIATDLAGNALVAWAQAGTTVASFDALSKTWSTPQKIAAGGAYAKVGLDAAGNGFVLWTEEQTSGVRVRAARYDGATRTVGTPSFLTTDRDGYGDTLPLAVNACGQAVSAWAFSNEGPISPPDVVVFR